MANIMEQDKILELLKKGKKREAKKALTNYFANLPVTKEDAGMALLSLSSLVQKVEMDLAKPYEELIEEVAKEFRDLNLKEKILIPTKEK